MILSFLKQKILGLKSAAMKFLTWENWPYWGTALLILLLIMLAVFIIRRRRKKIREAEKSQLAEKEEAPQEQVKETVLPRSALIDVWKKFTGAIPARFRRSILLFTPYIVMGESGAGKKQLIDNYTDWQGQARQFYPSYTADPLLRFYLGSKVLIQELSPILLNDTSPSVRKALLTLWEKIFKRKSPRVVIVLNGALLPSETLESLKKQAQIMRGKINMVPLKRRRSVQVRIALTYMDHVEGFAEFSDFLQQHHIPLTLELTSKTKNNDFAAWLEPYEAYLTTALTSLSAIQYLKIISFFKRAPEMFAALHTFTDILRKPDPLSVAPEVTQLALISGKEKDAAVSNPFDSDLSVKDIRAFNPMLKHQIAAILLGISGLVYIGFGYLYERNILLKTYSALDLIEKSPPSQYDLKMQKLFSDFSSNLKNDPIMVILPTFFPDISQDIRLRLIANIRNFYLIPEKRRLEMIADDASEAVYEKMMYLLSLIYASKHNELGKIIMENPNAWSQKLGFPLILITDYVTQSETPWDVYMPLRPISAQQPGALTFNPQPWMVFFNEISKSLGKSYITPDYFNGLRDQAAQFLQIINESDRRELSLKLSGLLKKFGNIDMQMNWGEEVHQVSLKQESMSRFLQLIQKATITYPATAGMSLNQLIDNISAMIVLKEKEDERFSFLFAGKDFVFSAKQINALIERSRIILCLREFISVNRYGMLFFRNNVEYTDLILNPSNDGSLFFTGKGQIDGRFTKKAFDEEVKPVLSRMPVLIRSLPIEEDEKKRFSRYIIKETETYAKRYAYGFRNYYDAFGMKANSEGSVRYILNQIQQPSSIFQDVLLTIQENTVLELEETPYFRPLTLKLTEFAPIHRLFREDKGIYPELERYKAILGQLQEELDKNTLEADTEDLKKRLTATGRIALSVFQNDEQSYLILVRKWMESVGITSDFQALFISPVREVYKLGITEVETTVHQTWNKLWELVGRQAMNRFPFEVKAEASVNPDWLKSAIHPNGWFWKSFNGMIAPVLRKNERLWGAGGSPLGDLTLPKNMLDTVNKLARLGEMLWDGKGDPIPMQFIVRTHPLPPREVERIVMLSYLQVGRSSVFGFNQQSLPQSFNVEWWKTQSAAVGIEFSKQGNVKKSYSTITAPEAEWSFHRLLRKAESSDADVYVWRIPAGGADATPLAVRFTITPNPWTFLKPGEQLNIHQRNE